MGLCFLALTLTAATTATLGVFVFRRVPDRPASRLFALHTLFVASWLSSNAVIEFTSAEETARLAICAAHLLITFVIVTFVDFVWAFPDRLRWGPSRPRLALYLSAGVIGLIASSPAIVREVMLTPSGPDATLGWPLIVFGVYALPMLVYANVMLVTKLRRLPGIARVQLGHVLVGTVASEFVIIVANLVIPVVTGRTEYGGWGAAGYVFTVIAVAVAITKHHLWDLSSAARRVAASILATGTLAAAATVVYYAAVSLWAGDVPLEPHWVWLAAGAILGLLTGPVYRAYGGLLLTRDGPDRGKIGRLLSKLGAAIVHAPPGPSVLVPILVETQRFFGAAGVRAFLRGADGRYADAGSVTFDHQELVVQPGTREPLPVATALALAPDAIAEPVDAGQVARFDPIVERAQMLAALDSIGASVLLPVRWEGATIGLLAVDHKLSRDMYHPHDIDLLGNVAAHAAIAAKNAELRAQILAEKERTEKVLAEMESGVVAVDGGRVIRLVNPAACALLESKADRLLGQHLSALPRALHDNLNLAIEGQVTLSAQKAYLDARRRLPVAVSTFHLESSEGGPEGAGIVFRDLRTEEELQRVERETRQLRFIRTVSAGMAHEIRNPLVAIRTFAELAPTRLHDPEFQESFLEVARSEIGRLEELVSQFMILARPAGTARQPVDLLSISRNVLAAVSATAMSRHVTLSSEVPPELPEPLGYSDRLHQALMNLLLNAIQATPEGGQTALRIAPTAPDAQEHSVVITIWNSGSYIPPADIERVFEPFFTTKSTGTGLGLAICHTIVDEHGGTISVESDAETGTAFIMRLPLLPESGALQVMAS